MPVPEFEHKVQQQLKELKLPPSDVVWEQLESKLRKRRRRRLILFFLFFGLLLSGAGILFQSQPFSRKTVSINQNLYSNDTTTQHSQHRRISDGLSNISRQDSGERNNLSQPSDTPVMGIRSHNLMGNRKSENRFQVPVFISPDKGAIPVKQYAVAPVSMSSFSTGPTPVTETPETEAIEKSTFLSGMKYSFPPKRYHFDKISPLLPPAWQESKIVTAAKPPQPRNNPKRWQLGLQGSVGASNLVSEGLLNIWEKTRLNDSYSLSGNLTSNFVPPPASQVRPGPGWHAGFFIRRNWTQKWNINLGVNYLSQSTRIQVGSFIDSLSYGSPSRVFTLQSSGLYRNGSGTGYTNRHRFIEIPLELGYTINPKASHPLSVTGGLALGKLIQTNALHYDQGTGVYFQDEDLFRKIQWNLTTGVTVRVRNNDKHPVELGARFRYSTTPLYIRQQNSSRHLLSAGVELKWFLR